jgi:acetyl-CoA synthetase
MPVEVVGVPTVRDQLPGPPPDTRGDQVAIIWEGDNPEEDKQDHLPRAARRGLQAGQRDEGPRRQEGRPGLHLHADDPRGRVAMLACTRIGAVHSIVFGGFSPDSLRDRINDSECRLLITSDESVRGGARTCR